VPLSLFCCRDIGALILHGCVACREQEKLKRQVQVMVALPVLVPPVLVLELVLALV
jgi:hypothetical protein